MGEAWGMKTRIKCPKCCGEVVKDLDDPCINCFSTGYVMARITPKKIDQFLTRPEKAEFKCICGKKESILRPYEGQIPHGWLNWDARFICNDCKSKIMLAALNGAAMKIQQIKESKDGS